MFQRDGYDSQADKIARMRAAADAMRDACESVGWASALSALMSVIIAEGHSDDTADSLAVDLGKAVSRYERATGRTLDGFKIARHHGCDCE